MVSKIRTDVKEASEDRKQRLRDSLREAAIDLGTSARLANEAYFKLVAKVMSNQSYFKANAGNEAIKRPR